MRFRSVFRSAALKSAVVCCGVWASTGGMRVWAGPVAESLSCEVRQVFEQTRGAVVKVEGSDKTGSLCGTGFFIDPNGTLLTAYSVGGESANLTVILPGNHKVSARCLVADARAGIAILKADDIPNGTPFLPLASGTLQVATPVLTVAYPMDMPVTPSFGLVSGMDLKYLGRCFATSHIRATVPVQRGQGGAPLLNMQGEVVGVVVSSIDNGSACFALPALAVEKIRHDYDRYGAVRPGWLGVHVKALNSKTIPVVEVECVEPNSPAQQAGLEPGDRVIRIGETPVRSPEDVLDASFFLTAGEKVAVTVLRNGGTERVLEAKPGEQTSCEAQAQGLIKIRTASALNGDISLRINP
jgi:serine protease Do